MSAIPLFGVWAITTPPSTQKTPQKSNIFSEHATIRRGATKAPAKIDEIRSLPYKPRPIVRGWPGSRRGRLSEGPETARFGRTGIPGRDLISTADLPRSAENNP
jgi:hypothetical protein